MQKASKRPRESSEEDLDIEIQSKSKKPRLARKVLADKQLGGKNDKVQEPIEAEVATDDQLRQPRQPRKPCQRKPRQRKPRQVACQDKDQSPIDEENGLKNSSEDHTTVDQRQPRQPKKNRQRKPHQVVAKNEKAQEPIEEENGSQNSSQDHSTFDQAGKPRQPRQPRQPCQRKPRQRKPRQNKTRKEKARRKPTNPNVVRRMCAGLSAGARNKVPMTILRSKFMAKAEAEAKAILNEKTKRKRGGQAGKSNECGITSAQVMKFFTNMFDKCVAHDCRVMRGEEEVTQER